MEEVVTERALPALSGVKADKKGSTLWRRVRTCPEYQYGSFEIFNWETTNLWLFGLYAWYGLCGQGCECPREFRIPVEGRLDG